MEKPSPISHQNEFQKINEPKKSVMVIDDSFDTLALQKLLLELEGFEVFTAQSGTEALAMLSKIDKPNLILLDMQMDDMTGAEFLTVLEERKPKIIEAVPVVFVTGLDEVPKSKAIGLIRKPADMDHFLKAVHRFVEMGFHAPYKH